MIWWFLILGVSTLVVVCVAIALYVHLRRHLQKAHAAHDGPPNTVERERQNDRIEPRDLVCDWEIQLWQSQRLRFWVLRKNAWLRPHNRS